MNKKKAEQRHSKRRAQERYGLDLTKAIRDALRGKIKKQKGKFLYRRSRRVSVWQVTHQAETYKIVYDKQRKEIVTFLPNE